MSVIASEAACVSICFCSLKAWIRTIFLILLVVHWFILSLNGQMNSQRVGQRCNKGVEPQHWPVWRSA